MACSLNHSNFPFAGKARTESTKNKVPVCSCIGVTQVFYRGCGPIRGDHWDPSGSVEGGQISRNISRNISVHIDAFSTIVTEHHRVLFWLVQSIYKYEKKGAYRVISRNTGTRRNRWRVASGSAYGGSNPPGQPNPLLSIRHRHATRSMTAPALKVFTI